MNKCYSKNASCLFILFLLFNLQTNATTCSWKGGNGNWSDASKWSCGSIPNAEMDVVIDSGIIKLDIDVMMASLKIAGLGTINGKANMTIKNDLLLVFGIIETEGNITVNGNLMWYWANFGGNGTVTINGTTQLMTKNMHIITGKLVILKGGGTWLEGEIVVYKGGELRIPVGQTFKEEGQTKMLYNYDVPANGIVTIEGTFLKTGSEDIDISNVLLKNTGNIEVTNGTLTINATFQNTGTIKVQGKENPTVGIKTFGTPIASDTAMARRLLLDAKLLIPNYALMGALPRLEKAYFILKQTADTLNTFFEEVLYYKAFCLSDIHFSMRRYEEGMNITDIIIDKYVPLFGLNSDLTARTYELRALTFYNTARLSEAIKALPKAIELRTILSGELPTLTMRLRLAQSYARKGDFEKAIFYYTQLLDIEEKLKTNIRRTGVYNDLGIVYKNLGDYEKALFYNDRSIDLVEKTSGLNHFRLIQGYENRGITTKHLGKYDEAIADFEHAYKIALFYWPEGTYPDFGNFYMNMADTYTSKGDYSKALGYYEKAIAVYLNFKEQEDAIAECHYGMAETYIKMGSTDSVSAHLKLAEKFNHYTRKGHFEETTDLAQLIKVFALHNQNYQLAYKQTGKQAYLDSAYQAAYSGIAAMDFMKQELAFSEGRSRLIKDNYPIYEGLLQTLKAFQQDATDTQAFQVAEQCKSLQLYEAMKNAEAISFGNIPPQYIAKEKLLQAELAKYDKKKQQLFAQNTPETDSIYTATLALQLEAQLKYDALKTEIGKLDSNYYHLHYGDDVLTLTELQTTILRPNQTLLSYFVGDSSLFVFVIKPHFYDFIEIKKDFPLDNWVKLLRGSLSADSFQTQADVYADMAFRLYEKLIKPVKAQLSEDLIIVPDGVLGYIPFEALLMQKHEKAIRFHDHAYLLRDHNISYSFSATLLREMIHKKHQTTPDKPIIAYAPFFDSDTAVLAKTFADDLAMRRDLTPLSNSGEEAFRIAKSMGGEAIVGKSATEQKFRATAQSARILHLATHGKADDKSGDYAFLAFAPSSDSLEKGLLYVRDLYNLTFNADMVVLSACETGIGKLQRGEGIISLARAFAYAGAKSIVTSLWSVNDAKTKDLMLLFYQNLKKGKTKDAALRQAKLSFIAKNIHPNAHPFFWAAFIGIGDMSAVR